MTVIEWDFERFEDIIAKLDSALTVLEMQKGKIERLLSQVGSVWVSMAGKEYEKRIYDDLAYIVETITRYREVREHLKKMKKHYAESELEIINKLQMLYDRLSV